MSAQVREHSTGGDTEYTITGNERDVDRAVAELLKRYNPAGYNTREVYRKNEGGVIRVIVTRWNSCD